MGRIVRFLVRLHNSGIKCGQKIMYTKYYVSYSKSLHNLELEHIFNKNRLKFSLIILIVSIACLSGKLMEICTSEADSTAEKTKDSNHGQHVNPPD